MKTFKKITTAFAITLATMTLSTATMAETAAEKAMKKDAMAKEAMKKDAMAKDAMKKDAMAKDAMKKDAMAKDAMAAKDYVIKSGDSLWKIAKMEYGDGAMWTKIMKANADINADALRPGVSIKLP